MLHARGITPVLAFFRIVGGFPYMWRPRQQTMYVTVSWAAAAWSVVVVAFMVSFCVAAITTHYTWNHKPNNIMSDILSTYWYLLVMLLYFYLVVRAHRLARVLRLLAAAGVNICRSIWGLEDVTVMAAVAVFLVGTCTSLSFTKFSSFHTAFDVLRQLADRNADLTITVLLTVLYVLVKLVSVEMEDIVAVLTHAMTTKRGVGVKSDPVWPTTDTSTQRPLTSNQDPATNSPGPLTLEQPVWTSHSGIPNAIHVYTKKQEHSLSPPPSGCLSKASPTVTLPPISPVLHLLALDDILREVVGYASPPLLLLLLNAAASTTMFLYNAIATSSAYYIGFISVLVSRMVMIVLIPDPMIRKREACRRRLCSVRLQNPHKTMMLQVAQAEEVLAGGSHFTLCGLFTLDRQTILTVSSFVVTYLVITLQFEMSKNSIKNPVVTCPSNATTQE